MNAKKASHNKLMLAVDVSKLEVDAREVERKMEIVRFTLASMLPTLRRIHDFFVSHRRNSVVFRGVRSWAAYCKVRLRVTPEGVFMAEKRLRLKQAALRVMQNRFEGCASADDYSPGASMQHPTSRLGSGREATPI